MALLHTGDRICASCGGMNGRHNLTCIGDESVEVISVYTRQQAIEDGILVDCEQPPMGAMRRQLMKWPLAMTTTAFHRYVWPIDEEANLPPDQSLEGRFPDASSSKGALPIAVPWQPWRSFVLVKWVPAEVCPKLALRCVAPAFPLPGVTRMAALNWNYLLPQMNVSLKQGIHSPKDLLSSLHGYLLDRMAICKWTPSARKVTTNSR